MLSKSWALLFVSLPVEVLTASWIPELLEFESLLCQVPSVQPRAHCPMDSVLSFVICEADRILVPSQGCGDDELS